MIPTAPWLRLALVAAAAVSSAAPFLAQAEATDVKTGWFDAAEVSVVVTEGNSSTQSFGLENTLRRVWPKARFRFKVDFARADTADDRYLLVDPGLTFEPGETLTPSGTSLVTPGLETDVEKYFVEARYDREIDARLFWNAGTSWDRNVDAGILNRYIAFGGLGHAWYRREDLKLSTTYGASYTDREEDQPDPLKDRRFAGLRLGWDYLDRFGKVTTFENDFTGNMSLKDTSDYTLDMTNALKVAMSDRLSFKVSLQWLYNSEPALEDVDVIARVELIDPDGIPGNGDEFFRTVSNGGTEITVGEDRVRKEQLDTVFRTTLVIDIGGKAKP